MDRLTILLPSCVLRTSGSRPKLPTRITLLMLPAMITPSWVKIEEILTRAIGYL